MQRQLIQVTNGAWVRGETRSTITVHNRYMGETLNDNRYNRYIGETRSSLLIHGEHAQLSLDGEHAQHVTGL